MLPTVFHAAARFGLGLRYGEEEEIGNYPEGWLVGQLLNPIIPPQVKKRAAGSDIPLKQLQRGEKNKMENTKISARDIYTQETAARFLAQLRSSQPFIERLVMFWSNHFTVSVQNPTIAAVANAHEAEAIRPHVGGYFSDMLVAAIRHPAMLIYLDNAKSFGAHSDMGRRKNRGINENLAREILELHTLGVNGGYTQEDVIALANILTGWTLKGQGEDIRLTYEFHPEGHEPGMKTFLGYSFAEEGEQEGIKALSFLARHPSTARHIATKLARHFIADAPPQSAIEEISKSFLDSGGHLPTVMQTLIKRQEAWQPLTKFKNPYEFVLSAFRLIGTRVLPEQALASLEALNFRPFGAASPAGFPDTADAWTAPGAILQRVEWTRMLAQRLPISTRPVQLAEAGFAAVMSENTQHTIEAAASREDGIAFALSSPEFQRR